MSKNAKKIRIQIVNPLSGCGHTCLQHARRFVKQRRAVWTDDGKLRFITAADILASDLIPVRPLPVWMACWRTTEAAVLAFEGRQAA